MTLHTKPREDTIRGLGPAPHERPEPADAGDLEAARARRCLDAVFFALARRMGTDALDELLLDAQLEAEGGKDWSKPRRQVARELADRLFRGRP